MISNSSNVMMDECYETPSMNVIEIAAEGVLCASSEDWYEEILPE